MVFSFYSNFNRNFYKQTVDNLVSHRLPMPNKKDARLIWINISSHLSSAASKVTSGNSLVMWFCLFFVALDVCGLFCV